MNFSITFQEKGSSARCGILKTYHSEIQTPVFMPIGTQGVIKTIDPQVLDQFKLKLYLQILIICIYVQDMI
ncbi:MAG: hypothetical protein CM1200mP1_02480 [Candidatus Neomarinimicrobiota bacterium]|nr:MAG: hypothetical protein CM1200mP1_02480 [Candidatus Neomarinimicrobiota bacterium]